MVIVIAKIWINGLRVADRSVRLQAGWNIVELHEAVAAQIGHKNFRLGYSFREISIGG